MLIMNGVPALSLLIFKIVLIIHHTQFYRQFLLIAAFVLKCLGQCECIGPDLFSKNKIFILEFRNLSSRRGR